MTTITQMTAITSPPIELTKLLLVHGLADVSNNHLVEKLKSIDGTTLETSQGIENLVAKVSHLKPDVLFLYVQSLHDTLLDELSQVQKECSLPVIVVAQEYDKNLIDTVVSVGISSYLTDAVSQERLPVILELSIARFNQTQGLIDELNDTKEKLSDRKIIERAKGILMQQKQFSEEEAYTQMRKSAMNNGQPMVELAKRIISVFEMLE